MPTWWIRRITLSPSSAYEGAPHETFSGTTKMPAGGARTRAAGGVTLERDHWITLPEPLCLGNVLRDWLAAGRTEEPLELLPRHRRRRADLRVLLDMAGRLHADERGADARRRAHELERPLRVAREPGDELGDQRREVARELSLMDRGRGHHGDAELAGRLQHRHRAVLHALIGAGERLGHSEVVGQLDDLEVMVPAAHLARDRDDFGEGQVVGRGRVGAKAGPGRRAVARDGTLADRRLECLEGSAHAA